MGHGAPGETDAGLVLLALPDVNGSLRGKALSPAAFASASANGTVMTDLILGLDPTDTPITDFETFGIRSGAGDLVVHPDPATLRPLRWRPGQQVCLATPSWPDGSPCAFAVREVCRGVLGGIEELGYEVMSAFEYEVRMWDPSGHPMTSGISYSLAEVGRFDAFVAELVPTLAELGIELAAAHTEAGPGLLELNVAPGRGLAAADDAALLKFAVKGLAEAMGLRASFLAKTAPGEEGSSGHVHMSWWQGETNGFAGDGPTGDPPPVLAAAIAGVLDHLPAASLLLNPTINSYKRLVPGWFAPVNVSWGFENRSCAVRAIRSPRPEMWRFECRRPGADANPYLALAALAASAADGVRRMAVPPPTAEGNIEERTDLPALPGSLESALRAFDEDTVLRNALGTGFSHYFATTRAWELKAWRGTVTEWERERYGPTV